MEIERNNVTAEEFIKISKNNGWGTKRNYQIDKVQNALDNSTLILSIHKEEKLIGCIRVLAMICL